MYKRIPLEYKGEVIHLHIVRDLPRSKKRGQDNKPARYGGVWAAIEKRIGDGKWYGLKKTVVMGEDWIARATKAVRQRAFNKGYCSAELTIIPTVQDGICFRWHYDPGLKRIRAVAKSRRGVRLLGRKKHNDKYRKVYDV